MKKLYTVLLVLLSLITMSLTAAAEPNLTIAEGDTLVSGSIADDLEIHGVVKNNNSNSSVIVMLKVYLEQRVKGQSLLICWGDQCLPPIEDLGLTSFSERVPVKPNSTSGDKFHCTVDQGNVAGTMVATFVFYDANNPDDSAAFTCTVEIGNTTLVDEQTTESITLSPNPAVDFINLNMTGNVKTVKIFNITGTLVNSIAVPQGTSNLNINLSNVPSGIYFLNVIGRDGIIETRRFVINK